MGWTSVGLEQGDGTTGRRLMTWDTPIYNFYRWHMLVHWLRTVRDCDMSAMGQNFLCLHFRVFSCAQNCLDIYLYHSAVFTRPACKHKVKKITSRKVWGNAKWKFRMRPRRPSSVEQQQRGWFRFPLGLEACRCAHGILYHKNVSQHSQIKLFQSSATQVVQVWTWETRCVLTYTFASNGSKLGRYAPWRFTQKKWTLFCSHIGWQWNQTSLERKGAYTHPLASSLTWMYAGPTSVAPIPYHRLRSAMGCPSTKVSMHALKHLSFAAKTRTVI